MEYYYISIRRNEAKMRLKKN